MDDIFFDPEYDGDARYGTFPVPPLLTAERTDVAVAQLFCVSRSMAVRLIESGFILCDGVPITKKTKLKTGQILTGTVPEPEPCEVVPEDIPLDIVYEDNDIIVVNKPSGMVVHPAPGHYTGTLVSALLWHCGDSLSGIGGVMRPGIVHRIDRQTSGLICIAKNDTAHEGLSAQLADHSMHRIYTAIAVGVPKETAGVIDAPIGRSVKDRKKMAITPSGRSARTHYEVTETYAGYSLLTLKLETGRTHQIRVHLASIGHPVLGDEVYGGDTAQFVKRHPGLFDGQMLHAGRLVLRHPRTGEEMRFEAEMPENMRKVIYLLSQI